MKENMILFLKGIVIGIAKIIPGVSGSVIAISLGVYDRGLDAITHFFDDLVDNFWFLLYSGVGVFLGIISFSGIVDFMLDNYYFLVMLFFCGLIMGGIPVIANKVKFNKSNMIIAFSSFLMVIGFSSGKVTGGYVITSTSKDMIMFFLSGLIEALGMVIPGISSTALLMLFGTYDFYIEAIVNLVSWKAVLSNMMFYVCFGLGLVIGIVIVSVIMDYFFKRFYEKTFAFILGIALAMIGLLISTLFGYQVKVIELVMGMLLLVLGIILSWKFSA